MASNLDPWNGWIGRSESRIDAAAAVPLEALSATLDRDDPGPADGDPVPPGWHWLYFLPLHRASEIGTDGHPQRGGFLPDVPLPRRMWAGSRIEFVRPLRVGEMLRRDSSILDVKSKDGRSGPLVFVRVQHRISDQQGVALIEEQDIVYRDPPRPGDPSPAAQAAPAEPQWSRSVQPDSVLLMRYSALTFNAHRIHYDQAYATTVEGYPGLVVHGPLLATLLLDLLRRKLPSAVVTRFEFRAIKPTFVDGPIELCGCADGRDVQLWVKHPDGGVAMLATAVVAGP